MWWLLVAAFAVVVIYALNPIYRWKYRKIPGPTPTPLLGSLPLIAKIGSVGEIVHEMRPKYGDMMKLFFGRTPIAYVSNADMAKQILSSHFTSFPGRGLETILPRPLPEDTLELDRMGVFEAVGDHWKTLRPHWHSYLSNSEALKHYSDLMAQAIDKVCLFLRQNEGQVVDIIPTMRSLTMEVVGSTAFGVSFQADDGFKQGKKPEIVTASEHIITSLSAQDLTTVFSICAPICVPLLRLISPVIAADVIKARRDLARLSHDLVRKARAALKIRQSNSGGVEPCKTLAGSFLSNLAQVVDKATGETLTEADISAQAALMVLAGYETTASTLSTTLWLMAANPSVQKKLQAEIDEQKAKGNAGYHADLSKFPYLDAVINETLRLYNPAGWIARDCVKPCEVGGHLFTPGMFIAVCIWSLHRNPEYWGLDAEEYRPERWLDQEAVKQRHPFAFLPFGAGPRVCPGKTFGLQEGKMALLKILSDFSIEAKEGETILPVKTREAFTIGPAFPVKIVPRARA